MGGEEEGREQLREWREWGVRKKRVHSNITGEGRQTGGVRENNSPICVLEVDVDFLCRAEELWNTNTPTSVHCDTHLESLHVKKQQYHWCVKRSESFTFPSSTSCLLWVTLSSYFLSCSLQERNQSCPRAQAPVVIIPARTQNLYITRSTPEWGHTWSELTTEAYKCQKNRVTCSRLRTSLKHLACNVSRVRFIRMFLMLQKACVLKWMWRITLGSCYIILRFCVPDPLDSVCCSWRHLNTFEHRFYMLNGLHLSSLLITQWAFMKHISFTHSYTLMAWTQTHQ